MNCGRGIRSSLLITAVLMTAGCIGGYEKGSGDPSTDPLSLLAERPALPRKLDMEGWHQPIVWRKTSLGPRTESSWCEVEAGGFRKWTEAEASSTPLGAWPFVKQVVCVFSGEDEADDAYDSLSLADVAGEDWPNFDSGETKPTNASGLDDLAADEWEIGCGIGNPDAVCAVWDFLARHDNVLTYVEFGAQGGGVRFPAMRDLIRSIDRHIAASLGSRPEPGK
jgi:hypothetical protein